jgi:hypothetical protein
VQTIATAKTSRIVWIRDNFIFILDFSNKKISY